MFPSPLPASVATDPARAAEREVYEALEKLAPQEVRAFHGVSWLARRRDGNAQDGEADFVVVRHDQGIVVLEVKGGVIARDGRTGKWLCDEFAKKADVVLPTAIDQQYFDEALPAAFQRALDRLPSERFDAIVADEGQDFHADWWVLLQLALSHPDDGILYVFHDDNQRIFRREGGLPDGLAPFELSRNLRNTKAIHSVASAFYSGGELVSAGPDGRPVELVEATDPAAVRRQLSRVLHRLITEEKIAPEEIAILSGRTWDKGSLAGEDQLGMFPITHDPNGAPGKVLFETIHRFKGLERPVVALVDIDSYVEKDNAELLYVGLTRARLHLVVVGSQATLAALGPRAEALRTRSA